MQPQHREDGDRLITRKTIAERLGISIRELQRNIERWAGFPKEHKLGHRTVRYSLREFNEWLEKFKSGGNQPA